jgi:hypothetical protein
VAGGTSPPRWWWPFQPRPLGDVAQCVVELLQDEAAWTPGMLCLRHDQADVTVWCTGFFTTVSAGGASMRLQGRDEGAVERAYGKAKKRIVERRKTLEAARVRAALSLPPQPYQPVTKAPAPASPESLEAVEERVRRLRAALAVGSSGAR